MKTRWTMGLGVMGLGMVWAGGQVRGVEAAVAGGGAGAGGDAPAVASATTLAAAGEPSSFNYIGTNKCKKCHLPEHKSWAKLKHASALETLQPGQATEKKSKHNLDPNKDYSRDATCVACHTVGF